MASTSREDGEAVAGREGGHALEDWSSDHSVHRVERFGEAQQEVGIRLGDDPVLPGERASGGKIKLAPGGGVTRPERQRGEHRGERKGEGREGGRGVLSMSTTVVSLRKTWRKEQRSRGRSWRMGTVAPSLPSCKPLAQVTTGQSLWR
jgi:hypothetical protein